MVRRSLVLHEGGEIEREVQMKRTVTPSAMFASILTLTVGVSGVLIPRAKATGYGAHGSMPSLDVSVPLDALEVSKKASPLLSGASVVFHTLDDDKDNDTEVTMSLVVGNEAIADGKTTGTRFPDDSDSPPLALDVHGEHRKDDLGAGTLKIHIAPNGHDTWKFKTTLTLTYLDGTKSTIDWGRIVLNQDSRDGTLTYHP